MQGCGIEPENSGLGMQTKNHRNEELNQQFIELEMKIYENLELNQKDRNVELNQKKTGNLN